jgi:hypothetical protein
MNKYNKAFVKNDWQRVTDVKFTSLVRLLAYINHLLYLLMKVIKCIIIQPTGSRPAWWIIAHSFFAKFIRKACAVGTLIA